LSLQLQNYVDDHLEENNNVDDHLEEDNNATCSFVVVIWIWIGMACMYLPANSCDRRPQGPLGCQTITALRRSCLKALDLGCSKPYDN
jgi:hypothetical protein